VGGLRPRQNLTKWRPGVSSLAVTRPVRFGSRQRVSFVFAQPGSLTRLGCWAKAIRAHDHLALALLWEDVTTVPSLLTGSIVGQTRQGARILVGRVCGGTSRSAACHHGARLTECIVSWAHKRMARTGRSEARS
jgi:hypothetical protein